MTTADDLGWSPGARTVRGPRGVVPLSDRERRLLEVLHAAGGASVDRATLAREVGAADARAVDFAVCRLRGKIEVDPGAPRVVLTVHGQGYALAGAAPRPPAPVAPPEWIALGDRRLDPAAGVVHVLGGEVPLTGAELTVLQRLLDAGGRPVPRERLAREVGRRLDRVLAGLRAKLEPVPAAPAHVLSDGDAVRFVTSRRRHNLGPLSPLLGRDDALERALALARHPGWIEIVGPVGVGKSALAEHVCARLADRLPGGGWWVACAGRAAAEVADAVAAALGGDGSGRAVAAALRARGPTAIVLDGLDGCDVSDRISGWVERGARVVTTSTHPWTDAPLRLGGLSAEDGRALYLARGGAGTDRSIDALVAALDGLPLAIELAARVAAAAPAGTLVARGAPHAVDAMTGGSALASAVEGAWSACDPAHRRALRELSCFRGSFDADDAVAVGVERDVLDGLVARSLIVRDAGWYRVLAVLRPWLARVGGPSDAAVARYRARIVARAAEWGRDPPDRAAVDRAEPDLFEVASTADPSDAVVAAHALACCRHRPSPALRALVSSLPPTGALWLDRFQWSRLEGDRAAAEAAIDAAVAAGADDWHVRYARIVVAGDTGEIDRHALGPEPVDPLPRARWGMTRGLVRVRAGDPLGGYGDIARALDLCRSHGFVAAALSAERNLAEALAGLGAPSDLVARRLERVMLGLEALGIWSSAVPCAIQAATHRSNTGRLAQARALVDRASALAEELELLRDSSRARIVGLRIGLADADPDAIVREASDARVFARAVGHGHGVGFARYAEAVGLARAGDRAGALASALEPGGGDPLVQVGIDALAALLDADRPLPTPPNQRHWARSAVHLARHLRTGAPLTDRHARRDAAYNPLIRALVAVGCR